MTVARSTIVDVDEVGVYHCVSRCVRRAFLCGVDPYNGCNYEHRRGWIAERLRALSEVFGIEVFAYTVMSNHIHVVIRNRPDLTREWSAEEVARRWCGLFPRRNENAEAEPATQAVIDSFAADPERVKSCRARLGDISWFMRCLNEPIARRSNREDGCKGRFWEGRFKCQRLMNEGAILACMAYVDLNPVRARMAETLEDSTFTSVYDRLEAEQAKTRVERAEAVMPHPTELQQQLIDQEQEICQKADWLLDLDGEHSPFGECVDTAYYLTLVEWTGQTIRQNKRGHIPEELQSVLDRFELDASQWAENVKAYGRLFYRVVGEWDQITQRARDKGLKWLRGRAGSEQLYQKKKPA